MRPVLVLQAVVLQAVVLRAVVLQAVVLRAAIPQIAVTQRDAGDRWVGALAGRRLDQEASGREGVLLAGEPGAAVESRDDSPRADPGAGWNRVQLLGRAAGEFGHLRTGPGPGQDRELLKLRAP